MKKKVLLTAFALPAIFAACTNDELAESVENQLPIQEIVGAKLVSSGLSINVGSGVDSRLTEDGAWTLTDKLGLGWLNAQDDIKEIQLGGTNTGDQILYANNMFQKESEEGKFTTYGNVYEGFHFAYFQYERMNKIGEKTFDYTKNNVQKELWNTDKNNRALYLSPQVFLSEEDVDGDKLVTEKSFELQKVTNQLAVRATIGADIKEKDALAGMSINNVKLTMNDNGVFPFVKKADLNPRKLPIAVYDEEEGKMVVSPEWTVANLVGTTSTDETKAIQPLSASGGIETIVEGEFAGLTNNEVGVNLITFPTFKMTQNSLSENPVTITLTTGAGYFTVQYTEDAEEGTDEAKNNEAIEKLVALMTSGYGSDKITIHSHMGINASLNINLNKGMFTPDYSNIKSEADWNQCVAVANALDAEDVKFTVVESFAFAGAIQTPDVENFSVATKDGKAVTVGTAAGVEWPAEIEVAENDKLVVNIAENTVLNVVGTETAEATMNATTINNEGTINVNAWAAVSDNTTKALKNEGRVIVEYGAYVYPQATEEGVIAYVVEDAEKEDIAKINILIKEDNLRGYANVNTLIVKTDLDLNAMASDAIADNRYESGTLATRLSSLAKTDIELAGGSLSKVLAGANTTVNNVKATEGTNNLNSGVKVANDITVDKDATLNITNTVDFADKSLIMVEDLHVDGTLNANRVVLTKNIYETSTGDIKVADNHAIYYQKSYQQDGSTKGTVELNKNVKTVSTADQLYTALENATDGSILILKNGNYARNGGSQAAFEINKSGNMKMWIVGADNTVLKNEGATHGIRIGNSTDPYTKPEINIQDVKIESGASREAVSAKYNVTVNLNNVSVGTRGAGYAILLDNGNTHKDGKFYDGTRTTVNAYNVGVLNGKIGLNALPLNLISSGTDYSKNVTFAEFNYVGGNITSSIIEAQDRVIGEGNLFVNGEAIN